jgi:hypothetical protein
MNEEINDQITDLVEEAPRQPEGTQPASVPGAENPESEEIKDEKSPNSE